MIIWTINENKFDGNVEYKQLGNLKCDLKMEFWVWSLQIRSKIAFWCINRTVATLKNTKTLRVFCAKARASRPGSGQIFYHSEELDLKGHKRLIITKVSMN